MMRAMVVLILVGVSAHARADGGMYTITIGSVHTQALGEDGKPTGKPAALAFHARGTTGCHLDAAPKARSFEPWVQGSVDEEGKLHADGDPKQGGASSDIATCARSVLINNPIKVKPGQYRVSAKVSFKRA